MRLPIGTHGVRLPAPDVIGLATASTDQADEGPRPESELGDAGAVVVGRCRGVVDLADVHGGDRQPDLLSRARIRGASASVLRRSVGSVRSDSLDRGGSNLHSSVRGAVARRARSTVGLVIVVVMLGGVVVALSVVAHPPARPMQRLASADRLGSRRSCETRTTSSRGCFTHPVSQRCLGGLGQCPSRHENVHRPNWRGQKTFGVLRSWTSGRASDRLGDAR
jgi:hypothetical protein